MSTESNVLPAKSIAQVTKEALAAINEERKGEQLGLYCRFPRVNVAMNKYFRFSHVTLIAAASGAGKSYLLNILEEDLTDTTGLNKDFPHKVILLSFKFEMEGSDELIRAASRDMGQSYNYLLSSEYLGNKEYNLIKDHEVEQVEAYFDKVKDRDIYYIETIGNWKQILGTVNAYFKQFKGYKFIVSIDHTLLTKKLDEKSDMELISSIAITSIVLRKQFGAMVILLGQLNSNIESIERRTRKELHYPLKTDIYAQAQLYWACDNVFILNRPELLGIELYGKEQLPTKGLVHLACIKSRKGRLGNIFFIEQLNKSTFIECSSKDIKKRKDEEIFD
jgi:replicative DNA helicase